MQRQGGDGGASRTLALTLALCCTAAVGCLVGFSAWGHARIGVALGLGLVIGGGNGFLLRRLLGADMAFAATSLARIGILSVTAVGVGLLLGVDAAWLVLVGVGVAQLVLSAVSAREALAR